ncbi:peroxisomal membrane protein pex14 [Coemansia sp. RSA 1813]|nr:peroxisomal membrane protein pex14 [Coemansia sp. RSA 1646]KAJ1766560.1 peroxisomal membrane protein pex14 [Coemansia sp. RSA 1843]KAJ2090979.1 peroxisomal membrane protein pex14 [Coemansia sp. RSA 986]KAJ2215134.1 peroxisomal membrane protein pex14 [Coemansia sp. RSA 487]KAJ2563290.1 peroxisomal membrane protein pex14 [Coemansia sp. RSA 1813]
MSAEAPSSTGPVQQQPALREDVIESAVRFLTDTKVQSSTLAKKISFLETKGLTTDEIEYALARSKSPQTVTGSQQASTTAQDPRPQGLAPAYGYANQAGPPAPPPPPPSRPPLDWKDYFIAAVVAGGLGYGLYVLVNKYVKPLLMVRDDNQRLVEEKTLLLEQNEATRKQLESLGESTTRILDTIAQQSQKTSEAMENMASVLDKISTQEIERGSASNRLLLTLDDLQREISSLSSKMSKASETTISDVQSDIRSLRSLLLSRRVPTHGASPSMPRPSTPGTFAAASSLSPSAAPVADVADAHGTIENDAPADQASSSTSASASLTPTPTIPAWQLNLTSNETPATSSKGKQGASE